MLDRIESTEVIISTEEIKPVQKERERRQEEEAENVNKIGSPERRTL